MNYFNKFSPESKAAISHLLLRILCLLIIEYSCAQLVQESSGMPAVAGNFVLSSIYGLGLILSVARIRFGYLIGMGAGGINLIAKIIIIFKGHEHFQYYPIVWITQSLIVIYFCYVAYKKEGGKV
ncbi:MAG: hypothetical protein GY754_39290 [bacterium]|nr:hypothetical protein [bacterium]